jgi:hypothetical protein
LANVAPSSKPSTCFHLLLEFFRSILVELSWQVASTRHIERFEGCAEQNPTSELGFKVSICSDSR